jgi:hypothetical protein
MRSTSSGRWYSRSTIASSSRSSSYEAMLGPATHIVPAGRRIDRAMVLELHDERT